MAVYVIAGIPVEYECRYPLLKERSEKYKAADGIEPFFTLEVTEERIRERLESIRNSTAENQEYLEMGTAFYKKLLMYDGMMLHASAVTVDGFAYLFSAPCGTGKSTHTEMWQKLLGCDRAVIINDDKPAIRKIGDKYYAFGTPFSGKHDISVNEGYPIKGICFVRRAEENSIHSLDIKTAMVPFFDQTIRPVETEYMDMLCERVDDILNCVKFYALDCRADVEAAKVSYNYMKDGGVSENQITV